MHPLVWNLGHHLRAGSPTQGGGEHLPRVFSGGLGGAVSHHLFVPCSWRLWLVEAHRGNGRDGHRVARPGERFAAGPTAWLAQEMSIGDRCVPLERGGREAALVARVGVHREVKLENLSNRPHLGLVGLLRVEVQQEPPQAVTASALGRDVVVHPRAGVAHRRKGPTSLDPVMVVEAKRVGAAAALGDTGPRRLLPPRPCHLAFRSRRGARMIAAPASEL